MTDFPSRLQAIKEMAEMDAWLWACDQIGGNITEKMASKALELELDYASLTDEEVKERWIKGPWNL